MKYLICLILIISFSSSKAQELKQVVKYHENPTYQEVYFVLKSNKKIKEGKYKMQISNHVLETGYYKSNLKDSTWVEFFPGTKFINTIGNYKNGLRTGKWKEYSDSNKGIFLNETGIYEAGKRAGNWQTLSPFGDTVRTYNYTLNQVTYRNPQIREQLTFEVKTPQGLVNTRLDTPPLLIDKIDGQALHLKRGLKIKYPDKAKYSETTGEVIITYIVDEQGNETDFKAASQLGNDCEEEVIRVLKLIPGKWLPGTLNGKPVPTKHEFKFSFNLRG